MLWEIEGQNCCREERIKINTDKGYDTVRVKSEEHRTVVEYYQLMVKINVMHVLNMLVDSCSSSL